MNEARTPVNSNETVQHLEKQLRNTSKMVEDLMLQEKSTRRKMRNVTLDWSGIDEERKRHLKTYEPMRNENSPEQSTVYLAYWSLVLKSKMFKWLRLD